jgi:hypothetical protein
MSTKPRFHELPTLHEKIDAVRAFLVAHDFRVYGVPISESLLGALETVRETADLDAFLNRSGILTNGLKQRLQSDEPPVKWSSEAATPDQMFDRTLSTSLGFQVALWWPGSP